MIGLNKAMLQRTAILSLFCTITTCAIADNTDINALNQNIASVQKDLQKSTQKKSELQSALAQTETSENHLNHTLETVQKKLSAQQQQLEQLQQQSIPLQQTRNRNRELLKQQIQSAYVLSQQPPLKMMLSGDGIEKTHRTLTYFHYLTEAQLKSIQQLEQSINAYQQNQHAIQKQNQQLIALKAQQLQDQENLKKTQAQRVTLIQTIDQQIKSKNERLQQLLTNKAQLEQTIKSLNSTDYEPTQVFSNKPFATLRGKLPWPVVGQVIRTFGTAIEQSELKWDGVLINAPQGKTVRAVASGRVIFAKWLAGYGLLVIINHGHGYMTLYGRNQTINKQVGEDVKAGDAIATVGKSGGFPDPALYFSIRHNAQALNPSHWCK